MSTVLECLYPYHLEHDLGQFEQRRLRLAKSAGLNVRFLDGLGGPRPICEPARDPRLLPLRTRREKILEKD